MSRQFLKWVAIGLVVSSILFLVLFTCLLTAPVNAKTSSINRVTTESVQRTPTSDAIVAAL
jgi:hypothetical protein